MFSSVLEQQHLALEEHIRSLRTERDALLYETETLNKARDDVIHEMVVLNTKNAELSTMNNDLSRRMAEREREAAAIMAGTAFIHNTPSPSPSTELMPSLSSPTTFSMHRKSSETGSILMQRMTSRDSNNSSTNGSTSGSGGGSKKFKLKKPKSNVFTKITNYGASLSSGGASPPPPASIYGAHDNHSLYNINTSSSVNILEEMKRKGSKQSSCDGATHSFTPTSFIRPVKCSACGEKIWGATEYRCQTCGSICHTKCLPYLPTLCYGTSSSLELTSPAELEGPKPGMLFLIPNPLPHFLC